MKSNCPDSLFSAFTPSGNEPNDSKKFEGGREKKQRNPCWIPSFLISGVPEYPAFFCFVDAMAKSYQPGTGRYLRQDMSALGLSFIILNSTPVTLPGAS
jgi:hypothetical protein